VSRIALVKPDRARAIEQLLMRMAQSGQLRGRVSEDQLIDVLDQVRPFLSLSRALSLVRVLQLTGPPVPRPQVEAMEKGQSGGAQKSGSKITVRSSSCSRHPRASVAALRRRRAVLERAAR